MDHPRFGSDSNLGSDMQALSGSNPELTSFPFLDNKSAQFTDLSEEEMGSLRDQDKTP
jgi:hypothetical protein